jgi:heme exporter protein A
MPHESADKQTADGAEPHVRIAGVGHRFGRRTIFHGVNLEVNSGQVAVVMGSNGAGKSTLLRIVAGLLAPTVGTVTVSLRGQDHDAPTRRPYIGYVAPDLTLYRELTGVENLEFFARLRGITLTRDNLKAILDQVGLLGRGSELTGNYSSGMRQRLKYAYALLGSPPVLLLDEPTANLDAGGMEMVRRVIAAQRERPGGGLTVIATNEPREETWGEQQVRLNASPQANMNASG